MRSISLLASLGFLAATVGGAQTTYNPINQIRWPLITGSGAPTMTCQVNSPPPANASSYGQQYLDMTNKRLYVCDSPGTWLQQPGANLFGAGAPTATCSVVANNGSIYTNTTASTFYTCNGPTATWLGPFGATGPVGPPGPPIPYSGPWSSATSYIANVGVGFNGNSFVSLIPNQNVTPPSTCFSNSTWACSASSGGATVAGTSGLPLLNNAGLATTYDPSVSLSTTLPVTGGQISLNAPETFGFMATSGYTGGMRSEGDSISDGRTPGTGNPDYLALIAAFTGNTQTFIGTAYFGSMAADTSFRMFNYWNPITASSSILQTLMIGTNDANHGGIGPEEDLYKRVLLGDFIYATAPLQTTGGSFGTPPTNWTICANFAQVTGLCSTTNAAVSTWSYTTTVTGQTPAMLYGILPVNQGQVLFTDSGGGAAVQENNFVPNNASTSSPGITTTNGTNHAVGGVIFPNPLRAPGTYTITAKVVSPTGISGGTGFTVTPVIQCSTATGSGAAATTTLSGSSITAPTLTAGGSYTSAPTCYVVSSNSLGNASVQTTIAGGAIASVSVIRGGQYSSTPTIVANGGCGGSGFSGTAVMGGSGSNQFVSSVTFSGGTGYKCPLWLSTTGGGATGSSATFDTAVTASAVTAINLVTTNQVEVLGVAVAPPALASCTSIPCLFVGAPPRQEFNAVNTITRQYQDDVKGLVQSLRFWNFPVYYVDPRNCLQGRSSEMADSLHPNGPGHANMAACWERPQPFKEDIVPAANSAANANNSLGQNWLITPQAANSNAVAYIQCNETHVTLTSNPNSGLVYLPSPASCTPPAGVTLSDQNYFVSNQSGNPATLMIDGGASTSLTNISSTLGATINSLQSCVFHNSGVGWWIDGCYPVSIPTSPTFAGAVAYNIINGADSVQTVIRKSGLTVDEFNYDRWFTHSGTEFYDVGVATIAGHYQLRDSANNLLNLDVAPGGAMTLRASAAQIINAGGTSPIEMNGAGSASTGGTGFYSGGATSTQQKLIDSAGLTHYNSTSAPTITNGTLVGGHGTNEFGNITVSAQTVVTVTFVPAYTTWAACGEPGLSATVTAPPTVATSTTSAVFTFGASYSGTLSFHCGGS